MSDGPLVVKLGGDALATPERIAAAARRLALRGDGPTVVVASARRGVTDHLLDLAGRVRTLARPAPADAGTPALARAAEHRAVASGEIVAASLLALALTLEGRPAVALDARQAGLDGVVRAGHGRIARIRRAHLRALLADGVTPVVAGFQAWHRDRFVTLGRGGSDATAVALAVALGAPGCELVKEVGGLHTADPRLVPEARPIPSASHRLLVGLAGAGARVVQRAAAELAARYGTPLHLTGLDDAAPGTSVTADAVDWGVSAVVARTARQPGFAVVCVVATDPAVLLHAADAALAARPVRAAVRGVARLPERLALLVPEPARIEVTRALHTAVGHVAAAARTA